MTPRESTQIVGIRLPQHLAAAFKAEAAARNVPMNALFREMWELYGQTIRQDHLNDGSKP